MRNFMRNLSTIFETFFRNRRTKDIMRAGKAEEPELAGYPSASDDDDGYLEDEDSASSKYFASMERLRTTVIAHNGAATWRLSSPPWAFVHQPPAVATSHAFRANGFSAQASTTPRGK